jgi:outer membrane protein OmpA-like peptidoglycan-associated protein
MLRSFGITIFCALAFPSLALAAPPAGGPIGDPTLEGDVIAEADASAEGAVTDGPVVLVRSRDRREQDWIERWAPEPTMVELGIYGGVLLPSENHEWFSPDFDLPSQGFKKFDIVAPDVGLRLGLQGRFVGIEAEGGVLPSSLREGEDAANVSALLEDPTLLGDPALLYTARGHLVLQLGLWSVTPFVLVGGGALGVASPREVLGNDVDPAVHFGGGLKFYLSRYAMLRVDVRDVVSYKRGPDKVWASHSPEVLLGFSFTFGRNKDQPLPKLVSVIEPVPPQALDSDGDGLPDSADACPTQAETLNAYQDSDGCPESDLDNDEIWDDQDACPDAAETINGYEDDNGCPESDRDGDGLFDEQDSCPDQAETANGYEDQDGCPDELPQDLQEFTGAIRGIMFDLGQDTIRTSSMATLDRAVQVLTVHPDIRIHIVGHTDDVGSREHNVDLSTRRAESVKRYLVEQGVDEGRITTEGLGPDKPVDANDTQAGRANNRRIEIEVITGTTS